MTHSRSNFENYLLPDSKSFSRSWFFSPVCLVAFSWITWSISVFHQPTGHSVCLSMQYLPDGVESMLLSSTSSGAASAAWGSDLNVLLCLMMSSWCNNVQISFSFFFFNLFISFSVPLVAWLSSQHWALQGTWHWGPVVVWTETQCWNKLCVWLTLFKKKLSSMFKTGNWDFVCVTINDHQLCFITKPHYPNWNGTRCVPSTIHCSSIHVNVDKLWFAITVWGFWSLFNQLKYPHHSVPMQPSFSEFVFIYDDGNCDANIRMLTCQARHFIITVFVFY